MPEALDWSKFHAAFHKTALSNRLLANPLAVLDAGPLVAWERSADGPCVYLSAGIHGDEPAGPLALLELLFEGFFASPYHWIICPTLNPSGLAAACRENANGIDLNRDYLIRESPEITAHAAWIDRLRTPDMFISLHEDWEATGFYLYEINLRDDCPDRARHILEAVSPWFPAEPGPEIDGHDVRSDGWIYHAAEPDLPQGWPEAIYLAKKGCPISFTFETPSRAGLQHRVAAHKAAIKAACSGLVAGIR